MGLLNSIRQLVSASRPSIAEVASKARLAQARQEQDWIEEAERQHRLIQEKTKPPFYDTPNGPFGFYPFPPGQYVCIARMRYDKERGEVYEDSRTYFADSRAVEQFFDDVLSVEELLDGNALGLPSLPALRTDLSRIVAVDSLVTSIPFNAVNMTISPLTPTGKKPRYVSSAGYSAFLGRDFDDPNCYRGLGEKGSCGAFWYLDNGSVGKAEIDYWDGTVHYKVKFKLIDKVLAVGNISYSDTIGEDPVVIYRA